MPRVRAPPARRAGAGDGPAGGVAGRSRVRPRRVPPARRAERRGYVLARFDTLNLLLEVAGGGQVREGRGGADGAADRACDRVGRGHAEAGEVGADVAQREREEGVAVERGVGRRERAREAEHSERGERGGPGPGDAVDLADAGSGARADAALGHGARDGARGRVVPHLARGAGAAVADAEVEEEGARHVRDDRGARGEADAALLEPAHDAVDRLLAEPAAAAEDDAVDRRDEVAGVEVVETDDVVGAAAERDAARRGAGAQHDRDAGEADRVGRVTDADPRDVGDHAPGLRLTSEARRRPDATSAATSRARRVRARANG